MKGSVMDLIIIGVILFVFAIGVILCTLAIHAFTGTAVDGAGTLTKLDNSMSVYDEVFVTALFILSFGALIGVALINTSPIFLVVDIILWVVLIFIATGISNAYIAFGSADAIATTAARFPYMAYFFQNLPMYFVIMGALILIVHYGKVRVLGTGGRTFG